MDNGNDVLSLAEAQNSVYVVLKLPITAGLKRGLESAFNSAKTALKATTSVGDHYVSKGEFPAFLRYLKLEYALRLAFTRVDTEDDGTVSFDEFMAAAPELTRWGIDMTDPKKTFAEAESVTKAKGAIPFVAFVRWAIFKGQALDTV